MAEVKETFVIDASVIIKWIADETEDKKQALRLRHDFLDKKIELMVPTLCFYEIMNHFGLKYREIATEFFSHLLALKLIEQRLTHEITAIALQIMSKYPKISFYDASYHATAIEKNATFVTADKKYFEKTRSLKKILLLKDYDA